jgi:hypothetical protein
LDLKAPFIKRLLGPLIIVRAQQMDIEDQISKQIGDSLGRLNPQLMKWVEAHLITPKKVSISKDTGGKEYLSFWLVTDHIGSEDSNHRVVYDEGENSFGLECTLENGVHWFMGHYGEFHIAVEAM